MQSCPELKRSECGAVEIASRNTIDKEEDTEILVKDGPRWTCVTMAHHPVRCRRFGTATFIRFTFNAQDFEPITGTVHQTAAHSSDL